MRVFTVFGVMFYSAIIIIIGVAMVILSLNFMLPSDVSGMLTIIQNNTNSKIIFGFSGVLLMLISFSFAQIMLGKFQREKTIAFTTSSGEVTIALSAVEDLIRRLGGIIPEIKELKPDVIATKKGLIVDLRIVLRSGANIPELTARLQDITRSKIQEVLGLEEQIIIKIHVAKIISSEERDKRKKDSGTENEEPAIPYGGYGRT